MVLLLARRLLFARRGRPFARGLVALAVGSVALAAFALAVVSGVFIGFRDHLTQKLLGFQPHLTIIPNGDPAAVAARLQQWAPVDLPREAWRLVPWTEGEAVLQVVGREGYADVGVRVLGVEASFLDALTSAEWFFAPERLREGDASLAGRALALHPRTHRGGMVVGAEVAAILGINPESDEVVRLIAPLGLIDPVGNLQPTTREFEVTGFFRSGLFQQDSKLLFVARAEAERALGAQAQTRWVMTLADTANVPRVAASLAAHLGPVARVETWMEQNRTLFGALALERVILTLLLLFTVAIAGISVLAVVMTQVRARQRDLAILMSIGATRRVIHRIVLAIGGWIGTVGAALGLGAAAGLSAWIAAHPIQLPQTFYLETLPLEWSSGAATVIALAVIGITLTAAWYPARQAARLLPAEALRSE